MECSGASELPIWLTVVMWLLCVVLGVRIGFSRQFWPVLTKTHLQHAFFASCLFLSLLWMMRIELDWGGVLHFSGLAAATLLLGPSVALLAGLLALIFVSMVTDISWAVMPINAFFTVVIPVTLTAFVIRYEKRMGRVFFTYVLVNAFAGGALAIGASVLTGTAFCWASQSQPWSEDHALLLTYLPLIMLPEGIINGMLTTGLMVYYPHWLRTFEPSRYLKK